MLPDKVIVQCKEILFSFLLLYTHFFKLYYDFIHIKMTTPVVVLNFKVT